MQFPVFVQLGGWRIDPHILFEYMGYGVGLAVYLRGRWRKGELDTLLDLNKHAWILASAALAALLGAVLVGSLDGGLVGFLWSQGGSPGTLGKSLVGGVLGGWFGIAVAKSRMGINRSTGDDWIVPLCVGIVIGRIGCFLTGLQDQTHGLPTTLPWGVDFGDGVPRHPTQLYESLYIGCVAPFLSAHRRASKSAGRSFRLLVLVYAGWRVLIEELKPTGEVVLGLSFIQVVCVVTCVVVGIRLRRFSAATSAVGLVAEVGSAEHGESSAGSVVRPAEERIRYDQE
jgi:prolipoprotein diacylglyceryltransferase